MARAFYLFVYNSVQTLAYGYILMQLLYLMAMGRGRWHMWMLCWQPQYISVHSIVSLEEIVLLLLCSSCLPSPHTSHLVPTACPFFHPCPSYLLLPFAPTTSPSTCPSHCRCHGPERVQADRADDETRSVPQLH